jgi:hypothetical protein
VHTLLQLQKKTCESTEVFGYPELHKHTHHKLISPREKALAANAKRKHSPTPFRKVLHKALLTAPTRPYLAIEAAIR